MESLLNFPLLCNNVFYLFYDSYMPYNFMVKIDQFYFVDTFFFFILNPYEFLIAAVPNKHKFYDLK